MDKLNFVNNQGKDSEHLTENVNSYPLDFITGNDEQEYLRATWDKLGVGQDGLLSLNDLSKVCKAIGIEDESIKVIKQLFEGLDVDGDGRITFPEFMQIFQNTNQAGANQSQVFDNSFSQDTFDSSNSHMTSLRSPGIFKENGTLHSLDPDNKGFVLVSRLLEIWCALGVSVGERFLKDLSLPYLPRQKIYLSDLSSALEEEVRKLEDTKQCGFYLLLNEIHNLRNFLDMHREEINKYRLDLNEANQRIIYLSQETDEHNIQLETASRHQISNLERQYKEQIRELQDALMTEEELSRDKVTTDIKQIEDKNAVLKEEENKLRQQIALQDNDIRKLVSENVDMTDRLKDSQRQIEFLEKQIGELRLMEKKISEYEQSSPRDDALLMKMEQITSLNQILRDKNDELLAKIDSFSYKALSHDKDDHSLEGSVIGDYLDSSSSAVSLKRRSHQSGGQARESKIMKKSSDFCEKHIDIHYVDVAAYDESYDTSLTLPTDKYTLENSSCLPIKQDITQSPKMNRLCFESSNSVQPPSLVTNETNEDESFRNYTIEYEQNQLISSTPRKTKCYNCDHVIEKLKYFDNILSDVKIEESRAIIGITNSSENDVTTCDEKNRMDGINTTVVIQNIQNRLQNAVIMFNKLLETYKTENSCLHKLLSRCSAMTEKIKRKKMSLTRFMADAMPHENITTIPEEDVPTSYSIKGLDLLEEELSLYEDKISREKDNLEKQKAVVEERNHKMENEIEMLRSDLASTDDYWQMKIKEEEDYYEEERKLYEEKFLELEKKIKEYEVFLKIDAPAVSQTENSDDSDRLSTIDENVFWEKQLTELEEELKIIQHRNEVLNAENDHIKLSYENELKYAAKKYEDEILSLKLEVEFLKAKARATGEESANEKKETCDRLKNQADSLGSFDLNNKLIMANKRIHKLESALKILQKTTCEILNKTQQRHQLEMESQQTILTSTQQFLSSCLAKYKDQTVKVFRTDSLVKNLCLENRHLMVALQVTEERQKKAESITRELEMKQLSF